MKIRKARSTDVAVIADFNARMAWETEQRRLDPKRVRIGVKELLRVPSRGVYFVAEFADKGKRTIAGQLLVTYEWSDWRSGNFWWIQSVYITAEFRGLGIFRTLFEHVQGLARSQKDVCGLRLYVDAQNDRAQQAYERLGMKRTNYQVFETDFVLKPHR